MPAVRSRRPAGRAAASRAKQHYSAPSNVPRLAAIKMNGITGEDVQVSGKSLLLALAGLVIFCGVAVAGAAWLGSSLWNAKEAFASASDSAASNAGFAVQHVNVRALPDSPSLSAARVQEVQAMVVPAGRHSVVSLDPKDVQARVESLDWVANARVRRLWPSTVVVEIARRQGYARWLENGEVAVINSNGERLLAERAADHPELPLVVGQGAGPAAEPLLIALESLPQLRAHLKQLTRVGDRRWNVELTSGTIVALPENNAPQAMAQLETLQNQYALLDRPVVGIDLRTPGRMAVRVHPVLAGGEHPLLGGA
ncbi:MAG: cell division protein FtsQ/DivIB [Terricaulis sp.]